MRRVGLHLRIQDSLYELVQMALLLNLTSFQSFLTLKSSGIFFEPLDEDCKQFNILREQHNLIFYAHASYFSNPSKCGNAYHALLKKELEYVQKLGATCLILHPGSALRCSQFNDGVDALARTLNKIMKRYQNVTIVLENIPHGPPSIGGNMHNFFAVLQKLEFPEKIRFCIDTAHAFAFGYDISTKKGIRTFMDELDSTIGLQRIMLIHFNDLGKKCGSKIDEHAFVGEGMIGLEPLLFLVNSSELKHVPLIIEPPAMSFDTLKEKYDSLKIKINT